MSVTCGCRHRNSSPCTGTTTDVPRRTFARINIRHLQHNLQRVRDVAPASRIMACVKANGYGHGLLAVARALQPLVDGLAVATLEEAQALRDAGLSGRVLLLEGVHAEDDWKTASRLGLDVAITDSVQLEWLRAVALETPVQCWLKLDTGMHRLGVMPGELAGILETLHETAGATANVTLMTHFASADNENPAAATAQLARFLSCSEALALPLSSANSAAILSLPDSHLDWVRPGYMLYGGSPFAHVSAADCGLLPVMDFHSQVISVRDVAAGERVGYGGRWTATRPTRIATVAAGYGDGYPRHAPDGTPVLVSGKAAPLAGTVSMDMLTVDVTDLEHCRPGDPVILWGEGLPVDTIAHAAQTIGYELLAAMPARTPREISH